MNALLSPLPGISGPSEREFAALSSACRSSGGLARGTSLARELEERMSGDFISLARLIANDHIFSFGWRHETWVPMFQFDPIDLAVKPALRRVLAELAGVFDGWTLAQWFVHPNTWLRGHAPVDLLDTDLAAVLGAARGDRFVARG